MLESIAALKSAITVLSNHQDGTIGTTSFLQMPGGHMRTVAAAMETAMQKHAELLKGVLAPSARRAAAAFIQAPQDYFDAEPTFKQSYAPASGEIFGILTQMKETFDANLAASQKEEMANQK